MCGTVQPPVLFLVPWGDIVSQLSDDKDRKQTFPLREWKPCSAIGMFPGGLGSELTLLAEVL